MGNLKACFIVATVALAACGSDKAAPDAPVVIHDSPMADTTPPVDAPPDVPSSNLSCFGMANPTTADATFTVSGTTSVGQTGTTGIQVDTFKTGVMAALDSVVSGANGAFTTGSIPTAGVPFNGYLKATHTTDRLTYLYPPNPITTSLTGVPIPILDAASQGQLEQFSGHTQNDTNNGMLLVVVTDCSATPTPIANATLTVTQGSTAVGEVFDVGSLLPQAAGTFVVFNVPDGATDVGATYGSMTFPPHTVQVHKKTSGQNGVPSLTVTTVRPGP